MSDSFSGDDSGGGGDDLERMLAAEESNIRDAGFSARVVNRAAQSGGRRRVALYGAGMIGFGVAAGSISEAASRSSTFASWVGEMDAFLASPQMPALLDGGTTSVVVAAVLAGLTCTLVAFAAQTR